jgi:hypothetical protein
MIKRHLRIKDGFAFALWLCPPTVCVTRAGAGGGTPSDWKKAEAWKMLENGAESPASGARFVRRFYFAQDYITWLMRTKGNLPFL